MQCSVCDEGRCQGGAWDGSGAIISIRVIPLSSLLALDLDVLQVSMAEPLVAVVALGWVAGALARREVRLEGGALLGGLLAVFTVILASVTIAIGKWATRPSSVRVSVSGAVTCAVWPAGMRTSRQSGSASTRVTYGGGGCSSLPSVAST